MADTEKSLIDTPGIPEVDFQVDVLNAPEIIQAVEVFGMTKTEVDKTLSIDDMAADAKATGNAIANVLAALNDYESEVDGRTAADLPFDNTQEAESTQEVITNLAADLSDFETDVNSRTAADLPFDNTQEAESTQEVIIGLDNELDALSGSLDALRQQMFDMVYPIGCIYISTNGAIPNFQNTAWEEVLPAATVNQVKAGTSDYVTGTGSGTVRYWRRIQIPEPEPELEDGEENGGQEE